MIRELMHDPMFLGMKSRPAAKEDAAIARDLLDTLTAHRETCVGMAANMIGKSVRIIAFADGGRYTVMYNPEIIGKGKVSGQRLCVENKVVFGLHGANHPTRNRSLQRRAYIAKGISERKSPFYMR